WVVPLSIYTIFYNTWDSSVYLLPVIWLGALWLAVGLDSLARWLQTHLGKRWATDAHALFLWEVALLAAIGLAILRYPDVSLRHDTEVQIFLQQAAQTLEPDSILITGADNETFALW